MIQEDAKIILFPSIGSASLGYITVAEISSNVPFKIERVFWTYYTPHHVMRGGHAHRTLHQLVFALNGKIEFTVENLKGEKITHILDEPQKGLHIPPLNWGTIRFSHNAVLLCLASEKFNESDYIREYSEFTSLNPNAK